MPVHEGHERLGVEVASLCAVAQPPWDRTRNTWFGSKLGAWPVTEKVPAKRSSKDREKGTLKT